MGVSQLEAALSQAYTYIESSNPEQAKQILDEALILDLDNQGIVFLIQCCSFWIDVFNRIETLQAFEQGETIINQWKKFQNLLDLSSDPLERSTYAFRKGIYGKALALYKQVSDENDFKMHAEIYRKMGLCNKRLGSYEDALSCLQEANSSYQGQAAIIAEMADCYDLCGESKLARLLFKEAFYIDADKVELSNLDSPLIASLIQRVIKEGCTGIALQQWISVYGILLGVLNIKRPLKPQEVGRLKQDIYARENELKDPENKDDRLKPRLMNLYLWLLDYYLMSKENINKINEILIKIKILDPNIYKNYFSFDDKKEHL